MQVSMDVEILFVIICIVNLPSYDNIMCRLFCLYNVALCVGPHNDHQFTASYSVQYLLFLNETFSCTCYKLFGRSGVILSLEKCNIHV